MYGPEVGEYDIGVTGQQHEIRRSGQAKGSFPPWHGGRGVSWGLTPLGRKWDNEAVFPPSPSGVWRRTDPVADTRERQGTDPETAASKRDGRNLGPRRIEHAAVDGEIPCDRTPPRSSDLVKRRIHDQAHREPVCPLAQRGSWLDDPLASHRFGA